jgi:PHS family inorganic phosphate transporter-like MFS transporter
MYLILVLHVLPLIFGSYYGTALFQPQIMKVIFGADESVVDNCWHNIVVCSIGLPGVVSAIMLLKPMGSKALQNWGFVAIMVCCLVLAVLFKDASHVDPIATFSVFCILMFAMNWGVNVTTFVLPGETFPKELRSTFNGLSAACAKVGALLGAYFFKPISDEYGIAGKRLLCSASVLSQSCLTSTLHLLPCPLCSDLCDLRCCKLSGSDFDPCFCINT